MSSPYTRPDWPEQQPPHAQAPEPQSRQWDAPQVDPHADPPTEPIPVVSDTATQQWSMDGPADDDVDSDAPTQQWTMAPPPAHETAPPEQYPPDRYQSEQHPSDQSPPGPPPGPPGQPPRAQEPPPPPPPSNENMRWIMAAAAVVVLGVLVGAGYIFLHTRGGDSGTEAAPAAPTTEPARGCDYPAQVLDLTGWNVTVPTLGEVKPDDEDEGEKSDEEKAADKAAGKSDDKKAKEINQPELATFKDAPYFQVTPTCDSVAFRAPVNGITTSGSKYPRSELREMSPDGSKVAAWSSSEGAHTFVVNEAFTALPKGKPNLVGVQIHDEDDDVSTFRLEGTSLYITEGDDTHHKLVTDKYVLGTRYEAKYIVSGDVIQAFYNGQLQTTITKKFSDAYFKAGAYTQANCDDYTVECNDSTYGETTVYSVHVEHS